MALVRVRASDGGATATAAPDRSFGTIALLAVAVDGLVPGLGRPLGVGQTRPGVSPATRRDPAPGLAVLAVLLLAALVVVSYATFGGGPVESGG